MILPSIIEVVWFILPAYIANSMATNASCIPGIKKFTTPVDFGKSWRGRRILGDGKTWRGLICGTASAVVCATLQGSHQIPNLYPMTPYVGFLLGFGALAGDMAESFIKRRMGFERGHPMFIMDQLDYIFGAYFLAWTTVPLSEIGVGHLFLTCLITLPIHFVSSIIGWKLGLKKHPW